MRYATFLTFGSLILAGSAGAELREAPLCGTYPGRGRLEIARHQSFVERLDRGDREGGARGLAGPRIETDGDLVLLSDDGTLVSEANAFDLHDRTLSFVPRGGSTYSYRTEGGSPEPGAGSPVSIGDDVTRVHELSFDFPYYGQTYRRVYLNSDGNLSFEEGDHESTARSLERVLSGPPRIAPFFTDLDATAGGEVRVLNVPDRFVVSWDAVPEWGKESPNTFQVELTPDGVIRFRFGSTISALKAIVGLSPGRDPSSVNLVDLGVDPSEREGAVLESFQRGRQVDTVAVAKAIYRELPDAYDALVLWTNFDSDEDDAFAYNAPVQNDVTGIGEEPFDDSSFWGSAGELESFLFMGDLSRYPKDPTARVFGAASRPTVLGLLSHEVGHRWLARALILHSGVASDVLLGRQKSHWSFFVDSDASFLEGNEIVQESEKVFRTTETVSRYSPLDLYLMGLAPASEVVPFFVVTGASASLFGEPLDSESSPRTNVRITGTRTDVTMDEVLRGNGPRRPEVSQAPTTFRHAWILLTKRDESPTGDEIAQLQAARNAFMPFFNEQTLGRAQVVTTLER